MDDTLEQIRNVKARYCRFVDTKDWQSLSDLFTEDAVLDIRDDTGWDPIVGRAALIKQISASLTHAKSAHQVHSPEITLVNQNEATIIWAMQDRVLWESGEPLAGVAAITGFGHYHERYVRRDGTWRIASIRLTRLMVEKHSR